MSKQKLPVAPKISLPFFIPTIAPFLFRVAMCPGKRWYFSISLATSTHGLQVELRWAFRKTPNEKVGEAGQTFLFPVFLPGMWI